MSWRCAGSGAFALQPSFTAFLSALPALNDGAFDAAIVTLSPVRRLRPIRAPRRLVANVPNPAVRTASSFTNPSVMASSTVSTAPSAMDLLSPILPATRSTMSDFFIPLLPATVPSGPPTDPAPAHRIPAPPCRDPRAARLRRTERLGLQEVRPRQADPARGSRSACSVRETAECRATASPLPHPLRLPGDLSFSQP